MDLIQSFIAIPEAAAKKQTQQINAASTTQPKLLTSQASTTVQVLPFKQQNEPRQILDQDDTVDLKAV
ncbi:MAG: hypothetical protein WA828_14660 [Coleofasciculaceae cyanobacterium]